MKNFILLFFAIQSLSAMAQLSQVGFDKKLTEDGFNFLPQKTSSINYRLIKVNVDSINGVDFIPQVETTYNYSNDRGGNYLHNLIPFASGSIDFDTSVVKFYTGTIFIPTHQVIRVYNTDNEVTEEFTELYDLTTFNPFQLETFSYGTIDLDLKIKLEWNGVNYDSIFRNFYSYTSDLLVEKFVERYYLGAWGNKDLFSYGYNDENLPDTILIQKWVGASWNDSEQYIYSYNTDGFLENILYQQSLGSGLDDNAQVLYTFNVDSQLIMQEQQLYTGIAWNNLIRNDYFYDSDGNLAYFDQYTWNGTDYIAKNRYTFTYETYGEVISIETSIENNISIFPNPAQDKIYISASNNLQIDKLQIFNSLGVLVADISVETQTEIEINLNNYLHSDAGMYMLVCYLNNGERLLEKLIVQ